jgi:4-hydroxy-tetrahydrodipicolinate reductase
MNEIEVILIGLGALGQQLGKFALQKEGLRIVGASDLLGDGKDLGEFLGLGRKVGVKVTKDLDELLSATDADLAIQATSSYLKDTYPQIVKCVESSLNVISTCEELSFPYYKYPELSNRIDAVAKEYDVAVLGTGINPGYLMDTLPIVLTAPCTEIRRIRVTRIMYSGNRRSSFQKKIGTGLSLEEFEKNIVDGKITGHVGLIESVAMLSQATGLQVDEIKELPPEAIISDMERSLTFTDIKKGNVAGLRSVAIGRRNGKNVITLEFVSNANVKRPYDEVEIDGEPPIKERIQRGVHGDVGTVGMVFNAIPKVLNSAPGLVTMLDLPLASASLGDVRKYLDW